MGRSSVAQLINRAKAINEYNNNAVASDDVWIDFFNEALTSMVEELDIRNHTTISYVEGTDEYDLPTDYYSIYELKDDNDNLIQAYRNRGIDISGVMLVNAGYEVEFKGSKYVIKFPLLDPPKTFTIEYVRYPAQLTATTDIPEIPTMAETALCYKAVHFALLNNSQFGQAEFMEGKYRNEMGKANRAIHKAKGV